MPQLTSTPEPKVKVLTEKAQRLHFYNFDKLLSFNAYWMFCVGPRGNGKTYGAKKKAIKDAINKKRQFIYVRRYREEMGLARDAFFDDIVANDEFPDWDFRVNGRKAEMAPAASREKKKRSWVEIGYFVSLSSGQSYKSVPFPNVWTIIFDEFILEKSAQHYLQKESDVFKNFYNTVDRSRDQVRVFFLANAVSIMNPYFLDLGIRPGELGEMGRLNPLDDGTYYIAYHFINDPIFTEQVEKTKFGQFNRDSAYGAYANRAEFSDNNDDLVSIKSETAKPMISVETKEGTFSVWKDRDPIRFHCQQARPAQELLYTLDLKRVNETRVYLPYSDKQLQVLRACYNSGKVTFDAPQTRNMFTHIFNR